MYLQAYESAPLQQSLTCSYLAFDLLLTIETARWMARENQYQKNNRKLIKNNRGNTEKSINRIHINTIIIQAYGLSTSRQVKSEDKRHCIKDVCGHMHKRAWTHIHQKKICLFLLLVIFYCITCLLGFYHFEQSDWNFIISEQKEKKIQIAFMLEIFWCHSWALSPTVCTQNGCYI